MTISLGSVVFSNNRIEAQIDWKDRLTWQPVGQSVRYALGGNPIIVENERAGRPITLVAEDPWCWLTHSTVLSLVSMASQLQTSFLFTWNSEVYTVCFKRDSGPLDLTPLNSLREYYTGSIYLISI